MGNDQAIVDAARVSYGDGTKKTSGNAGLINYLMRHSHTSPFEMCEIKFHIKMPIFVARQWIRHRTASLNEYSARYSVMRDEFYIPDMTTLAPQSSTNKQGRAPDPLQDDFANNIINVMKSCSRQQRDAYEWMLAPDQREVPYFGQNKDTGPNLCKKSDACSSIGRDDPIIVSPIAPAEQTSAEVSINAAGLSRELARIVLPLNTFTEMYWKIDLHNLMHF
ncbi:unnamed protein product [Sphagnum jensenii]|uniref:Thymidylate synthase n=1 Tax=Sphagnum jensenii TaxID=128206 RepID=A0ABP0VES5_9BRYO